MQAKGLGLDRKKKTFVVAVILFFAAVTGILVYEITRPINYMPCVVLHSTDVSVSKVSNYNLEMDWKNMGTLVATLDRFLINDKPQQDISGLVVFFNGTGMNVADSLDWVLKPGETVRINLLIPIHGEYVSGTVLEIALRTTRGYDFPLQDGNSSRITLP
jgi:hypothetical protein